MRWTQLCFPTQAFLTPSPPEGKLWGWKKNVIIHIILCFFLHPYLQKYWDIDKYLTWKSVNTWKKSTRYVPPPSFYSQLSRHTFQSKYHLYYEVSLFMKFQRTQWSHVCEGSNFSETFLFWGGERQSIGPMQYLDNIEPTIITCITLKHTH